MDNQARTRTKSKKPPARPELEPISYEEIMANAGMSGFVSFLDAPESEPVSPQPALAPESPAPAVSDTVKDIVTVQQRKSTTVHKLDPVQEPYTVQPKPLQDIRRWK